MFMDDENESGGASVVIFEAEVRDEVFAAKVSERVLEFHQLDEDVVFGVESGRGHRRLEVEGEPLLYAAQTGALREVEEEREVEDDGRGEYGVAAEEVNLDLHRVAEPAEDVYVVPALLIVAARRVVVDAYDVREVLVELRVDFRPEDVFEDGELRLLFGLEGFGVVKDFAVAVAEDVGRVPAVQAQHARLESGRGYGLHQGRPGLEVLAADRSAVLTR